VDSELRGGFTTVCFFLTKRVSKTMTQADSSGHAAEQQIFTPQEVVGFQTDDGSAATYIVGLMVGIFTLGLIGYIGVCLWVRS
jgi:hypothetical protein